MGFLNPLRLVCLLAVAVLPGHSAEAAAGRNARDTSLAAQTAYDDAAVYGVDPSDTLNTSAPPVIDNASLPDSLQVRAQGALPTASAPDSLPAASISDSSRARADSVAGALELQEKSVKTRGSKVHREKEVSRIRLSRRDIQRVAAAQGDPLKVLSTLPGVTNQNDLSVRPFVRGGKAEETQILWNGVTLLQPYHFGTLYSIFNTESLENMTLYTGGFPVEAGNALSAALFMEARPAPMDSLKLFADISFLRGSTYIGVPVIRNRLSVSLSWQAFWYDWVVNRAWDLADIIQSDSNFSQSKQEFRRYLQLPNFRDLQFGLNWKLNDKVDADYVGLFSRDGFRSREPTTLYYQNGKEVSDRWYFANESSEDPDNDWTFARDLDTIANVTVTNQVHGINFQWRPTENLDVTQRLAYQRQEWNVKFMDEETWHDSLAPDGSYAGYKTRGPNVRLLELEKEAFDWSLDAKWQAARQHLLKLGLFQSIRAFDYETKVERSIYEIIVNGSVDVTDGLGYLNPNGLLWKTDDPGFTQNADYLTSLPRLIRFDYQGEQRGSFVGAYLSDDWALDERHRLTAGVRAEMDTWSGQAFLSPRAAWFQAFGSKDEITLATGLYSSSDFPFNQRDVNHGLKPEKAFHLNAEWSHHFSKHYRMEFQLYQKNYYDLVVPVIQSTGAINWDNDLLWGLDSAEFASLPAAIQATIIERVGEKDLGYTNDGIGKAGGGELSIFYDPMPFWSGWVSAEAGYSKRRDLPGQVTYDFRYHRPWAFNWVNYFHLPSNYELSIRGRYAAGLPYSEFKIPDFPGASAGGDTAFYLSPRNSARFAPYSRWDLRLTKNSKFFGRPMQSYMEIWNMFNTPNFIMRDQKTASWKFFDANYPIPILFMGINYRW